MPPSDEGSMTRKVNYFFLQLLPELLSASSILLFALSSVYNFFNLQLLLLPPLYYI